MKANYTHITVVLDRSGSMCPIADDTIGGFNTFLTEQQTVPGESTFTLVQFDHEYQETVPFSPISEVHPLTVRTYQPRGRTALLDSTARAIRTTGQHLNALTEENRPSKIIFAIITDGYENASRETTHAQLNAQIEEQKNVYKWEFVFLGANQDAIVVGTSLGMNAGSTMSYSANSVGVRNTFQSFSANARLYRSGASSMSFSETDRADAVQPDGGTTGGGIKK